MPSANPIPIARNQSLDLCKLIAACFVIFIHIPFPDTFGSFVTCLARFSVPLFFAISGWFSYRVSTRTMRKRFFHLLRLELIATLIYILCNIFWNIYYGGTVRDGLTFSFTGLDIINWILFNANPFRDTLWFLSGSAMCYCLLGVYTKFFRKNAVTYRYLYLLCGIGLIVFFCVDEFHQILGLPTIERIYYRNGLLMGLPFFSMGLFLREYEQKILTVLKTRQLLFLLFLSLAIACAEWLWVGYIELYVGTVLFVAVLLLLTARHPSVPTRMEKYASRFGPMSTLVYILHPEIIDFYARFVQHKLEGSIASLHAWFMPIIIVLISLSVASVTERAGFFLRRQFEAFGRNP